MWQSEKKMADFQTDATKSINFMQHPNCRSCWDVFAYYSYAHGRHTCLWQAWLMSYHYQHRHHSNSFFRCKWKLWCKNDESDNHESYNHINICQNNCNIVFFNLLFSPGKYSEGWQQDTSFKVYHNIKVDRYCTVHICLSTILNSTLLVLVY